jgi:hypothetical protein
MPVEREGNLELGRAAGHPARFQHRERLVELVRQQPVQAADQFAQRHRAVRRAAALLHLAGQHPVDRGLDREARAQTGDECRVGDLARIGGSSVHGQRRSSGNCFMWAR